jgi:hypothetical protein
LSAARALLTLVVALAAFRWFVDVGGRGGTNWQNRATWVNPHALGPHHPVLAAAHVSVPAHFAIALDDEMPGASLVIARTAYGRLAGAKELLEIEGGHFAAEQQLIATTAVIPFSEGTSLAEERQCPLACLRRSGGGAQVGEFVVYDGYRFRLSRRGGPGCREPRTASRAAKGTLGVSHLGEVSANAATRRRRRHRRLRNDAPRSPTARVVLPVAQRDARH